MILMTWSNENQLLLNSEKKCVFSWSCTVAWWKRKHGFWHRHRWREAVWVDTCMLPSGVTLTSLNISVIVVDSVSCGLMQLFQAGTDMLHVAEEQFERRQRPLEWTYFSQMSRDSCWWPFFMAMLWASIRQDGGLIFWLWGPMDGTETTKDA